VTSVTDVVRREAWVSGIAHRTAEAQASALGLLQSLAHAPASGAACHPAGKAMAGPSLHSMPTLASMRKNCSARRLASLRFSLRLSSVASKSIFAAWTARQVM